MSIKMLFFVLLSPVLSYCVLLSSFLSYLVPFYPIPPCLFLSLPILFFPLWSCPVLSCPLTSAPRLLYPGRRAGAGLFLWDFSGMRLGSQPASTGREPLQCASADAQVDRTSPADSDSPPHPQTTFTRFLFLPYVSLLLLTTGRVGDGGLGAGSGPGSARDNLVGTREYRFCAGVGDGQLRSLIQNTEHLRCH